MRVLAFDCGSELLALAVKADARAFSCVCDSGEKQAESLLPLVESAMARCGLEPRELDLVVCARGPGSFTGLRIAMSTAKGIAAGSGAAGLASISARLNAAFWPPMKSPTAPGHSSALSQSASPSLGFTAPM